MFFVFVVFVAFVLGHFQSQGGLEKPRVHKGIVNK